MIRQVWVIWKNIKVLSNLIINFSKNMLWNDFFFLCDPPITQKDGEIQGGGGGGGEGKEKFNRRVFKE